MTEPYIQSTIKSANLFINSLDRSILIVGQKLSGTASSGALIENILTEAQFNTSFGRQSRLAKAGRELIKTLSISRKKPKISAIGLDDNVSGVAATGSIAFSGTATASGTVYVYVDSLQREYAVAITSGQTATQIGTTLAGLITADLDAIVTASNASGTVTLTAINKGTCGNSIGIFVKGSVDGITATLTAFSGGLTNPSLTTLFDSVAENRYTSIIYPADWTLSNLYNLTEARFSVNNKIMDGVGIVCSTDTYANHNSTVDGLNYKTLTYLPNKLVNSSIKKGGAVFADPFVIATVFTALRELRLTDGANVSLINIANLTVGGALFGAVPYHNTPLLGLPIIPTGEDFSQSEKEELSNSGAFVFVNNIDNSLLILGEDKTTYKTNNGIVDKTFQRLNYVDTLTLIREFIFTNLKKDCAQKVLTTGEAVAGLPQINKDEFIGLLNSYYLTLCDVGYGLLRKGSTEQQAFQQAIQSSITINLVDGIITTEAIANITTQLRDIVINFTPTFN